MAASKATRQLTLTALFIALVVLLGLTPLGLIPLGFINVTICLLYTSSVVGISTDVKLVAPKSIPRSEGKAKRVIDKRKL